MKSYLSSRVKQIKPSGIRRFFDLAANVEGVISLGVGEPDFITPWPICQAAISSIETGHTFYTENAGLLELRREIAYYMQSHFNVSYFPESEIIVTIGGSQALDVVIRTILNPGDEVIVIEPSYLAYAPLISLAGGKPVSVETSIKNEFKPQPEQLQQVISSKTKAILFCSPNNPTGSLLSKGELERISKVIIEHDLLVISDDIYAELTYDEEYCSIASIQGMRERTIIVSGFSKCFAMTGWRLGYICAPEFLTKEMLKIHQYSMISAPSMAQYGAIAGLKDGHQYVEEMRNSYLKRRDFMVNSLNEMGLDCHNPGGAFYVFPSIRRTGLTSDQFAEKLLLQERVAVVPGSVFGAGGEGYIRCSYASSMESLQEAIRRMKQFLESIQ